MSDIRTNKFLNTLRSSFDISSNVIRDFTVSSVIKPKYEGCFPKFLDRNKHDFYHKVPKYNQYNCCQCGKKDKTTSGYIKLETFYKFYFKNKEGIRKCATSKSTNGAKISCLCQILSVQSKNLRDFDQSDLICILLEYNDFDVIMKQHIKSLREVRNRLCHSPTTTSLSDDELNTLWNKMKEATLALAEDVSLLLHDYVKEKFNPPSINTDSTERIVKAIKDENKDIKEKLLQSEQTQKSIERKFDNLAAVLHLSVPSENKDQISGQRPIRILVDAESQTWDEDKVMGNISKHIKEKGTEPNGDSNHFHINSIEKKCINFNMTASSDVFADTEKLEMAIDNFIERLIKAGDVDVSKPGKLELNITVISPLTKEEKRVVLSLFSQKETSAVQSLKNEAKYLHEKDNIYQNLDESSSVQLNIVKLKREPGLPLEIPKSSFEPKRSKQDTDDCSGITDDDVVIEDLHSNYPTFSFKTKYYAFTIEVDDVSAYLEGFEGMPESQSGINVCVHLAWDCPHHWKLSEIVDIMNKRLMQLKGWFKPVLVYIDKMTGRLIIQCYTQCHLFSSRQQFEHEVKTFIERIEDKCQLQEYTSPQGDTLENVGISLSVIMPPDGYMPDDDLPNLKPGTEKENVAAKRTDLDNAFVRLGVIQCLEIKYKEYSSKIPGWRHTAKVPKVSKGTKKEFYSYLRELARLRKGSLSTRNLIQSIQSNLSLAVSEFPVLDLFDADKYIYSCGNCSSSDVICWCKNCKQLYCFHCLAKHHKDISHRCVFDDKPSPALTFIKQYDIRNGKEQINCLYDMKVLDGKLIILGKCNQQLKLILWKDDVLDSKLVDDNHDNVYFKIAVIDSHTCVVQTKMLIIIFTINNSMINELLRIQMDKLCRSLAHVNGILYVGTDSGIIKMTLEGNKVGEIKCENLKDVYANGTQIYYTTDVRGQYVNVIDTTRSDTMRSLDSFPTCPDQMDFTSNGNIVFLKYDELWFTCDEGQCNCILIRFDYFPYPCFSLSNDEIYSPTKDNKEIKKYKLNEEMLTQLTQSMSQLSTSGTSFQKSLQDPEILVSVTTGVSVPVTSVSIAQTATAVEQGCVVYPDIETPEDPGFSVASLRYFPMDRYSSQMNPMPRLNQQSLQQERNTTLPVGESYLPFTPLQTFPPGEEPYHQPLPELGQPFLQHGNFQAYDPRREGPVNPAFEVSGSSNALQNFPLDHSLSQIDTMPLFGHQSLPQERDTQRERMGVFQPFSPPISYSDVAFRQLYGNPGPWQPPYTAPHVHTYGRPPHSPPGDDNITSDEDLSDESRD